MEPVIAGLEGSYQRMLSSMGGVPELLMPDNLQAAVTKACRYSPTINVTYAEMAAHHGADVLPKRPDKTKDKAKTKFGTDDHLEAEKRGSRN